MSQPHCFYRGFHMTEKQATRARINSIYKQIRAVSKAQDALRPLLMAGLEELELWRTLSRPLDEAQSALREALALENSKAGK
jgi:hypothetical protein